ncbi:cation-translocating P-type ATPase [Clostridium intestinale]|uniref:P-type Ca(2+) transporter n=1 Tax=Clostridium intestinale DSM 6191 TaxID=1121320 RepID=A0A1M5SUQ1_9CLOT|nr:cation-translocating P-type ATPase [Clostridium intestinale]SHH42244.1 Ca2+-transporting ATPase [Clostridium intestinale DSM 6191]
MWFSKTSETVLKELNSNISTGLSDEEAKKRLSEYGPNRLSTKKKKTLLQLFISQLADVMIYILFGAAIISAMVGEISDSIIILIVIFINAIIGVVQESKAEKALEALKELSTPKAIVKRGGELKEVQSEEVVLGDIVVIDAGRFIPADLRLIESANLKIDEAAFTGESVPADKDAMITIEKDNVTIGDQHNMAFMSTLATYGRGIGVVVGTSMDTQIGKIAKMIDEAEEDTTPLQKRLANLGKTLGFAAIFICGLIFVIALFQGRDMLEMFLTAISLAVAAIPEGLPAIVAIVLAMGVQRMIKENAIIRKLPAVETLGSVNIICSDKTGTLTQNKMTVTKFYADNSLLNIDNIELEKPSNKLLIHGMVLCNDATYTEKSKTGDPTEIALLEAGVKYNLFKESLNEQFQRIDEIPFDSDRKLMTTVNKHEGGLKVFTKGAIDSILKISNKALLGEEIVALNDEVRKSILKAADEMSDEALRVLACAYKEIDSSNVSIDSLETNLIYVGMMGMIDPPRLEVRDSIKLCKSAGITPIMITGDYRNTAFAIAKELGIAENIDETISGDEIDKFTEETFNENIKDYKVFARVSPEHKVKIVKAFKSHGNIVSMTGDGVNDAPSLKTADIGVAMGITGTDVAKGAADMILTDDNFTTIVSAVEEGRNIYNNIRKSIIFLLSCNFGEIVTLFVAILLNWDTPLLPIHILWVNLITDSFPALSLGVDPGDKGVMNDPPRNPKESLFSGRFGVLLAINGAIMGALTLVAFRVGEYLYPDSLMHAQTMAFVVLAVSQLFYALSVRNPKKTLFEIGPLTNKYLLGAICLGILLQLVIISIPPIAEIFKVFTLTSRDWGFVILLSLIPFILNELIKILFRKR